jgi:prefoldin subunit 5
MMPEMTGSTEHKTPTLEEIHGKIYELNELVNEIQAQGMMITDFLLGSSAKVEPGLDKSPESPMGKLDEVERTIDVAQNNLASLHSRIGRIITVLGCADQPTHRA